MIEKKSEIKSDFVGYLGVKDYSKVEKALILPMIQDFFSVRGIKKFKIINEQASFADLDFDRNNFSNFFAHFYHFLVDDIRKNDEKVETKVTYCITLDVANCGKICDKTGIRYDDILLYNQPVFYFIHVDVNDIFKCLRSDS